jgi:hypothetical protein
MLVSYFSNSCRNNFPNYWWRQLTIMAPWLHQWQIFTGFRILRNLLRFGGYASTIILLFSWYLLEYTITIVFTNYLVLPKFNIITVAWKHQDFESLTSGCSFYSNNLFFHLENYEWSQVYLSSFWDTKIAPSHQLTCKYYKKKS